MPTSTIPSARRVVNALLAVALVAGAATGQRPASAQPGGGEVVVQVLSNRPDLLSGGDALVEVVLPSGADAAALRVDVDGRDVSEAFAVRAESGGRVLGLVDGLPLGASRLTARLPDGRGAALALRTYPIGGPVFSGPQIQPFTCTTEEEGLGPPQDAQCNVPTQVTYHYRSALTGEFEAYDPSSPPPGPAIATTTTDQGVTVPYIVRREVGVQNRGIYALAVLADPEAPWTPWARQPGWNQKVVWPFGGSGNPYHAQDAPLSVLDDNALSRGFMVATSHLNIQGRNWQTNVSAEAIMMLQEHIVETYGEIRYTIGQGCSGGSIQQTMVASMYPGLLDGLLPACSFPDNWTIVKEILDCWVLQRYFDEVSPQLWGDQSDQGAVQGKATTSTCRAFNATFAGNVANPRSDPESNSLQDCGIRDEDAYSPERNPDGVRCTMQDYQEAVWGHRPEDGFARRPWDNVGIQYGLRALREGTISPEQFVDLNARVGGLDIDFGFQEERSEADLPALPIAYRTAQVADPVQLANVPILDLRGHSTLEFHEDWSSYAMRERLVAANGHANNQVIYTGPAPLAGSPAFSCAIPDFRDATPLAACTANPLVAIDAWLARIEADGSDASLAEKVVANRPPELVDTCFVGEQRVTDQEQCQQAYPATQVPSRVVAGERLAHDVLKCQLAPLDRASYEVEFTDDQWARLQEAFPAGVCDWSRPGVGQQPSEPWQTFAEGPGGRPLGPPPTSVPLRPAGATPIGSRLGGRDRVATAIAVSQQGWPAADSAPTVVLARGDDPDGFADALAGGPLAASRSAPLLLTPSAELPWNVERELGRLLPEGATVTLLGGERAIEPAVEDGLRDLGLEVRRIAGPTRVETAVAIAGELGDPAALLIATSDTFPDALSAGAAAAHLGGAVLLAPTGRRHPATDAYLAQHPDVPRYAVGGPVVEAHPEATPVAGAGREATAVAVARRFFDAPTAVGLASSATFPDALSGGPHIAARGGPVLLTGPDALPVEVSGYLCDVAATAEDVIVYGGTGVVSAAVLDGALGAAGGAAC